MALSRIKTNSITDDAITAAKIADGTIVAADLAANSVDSSELVDGGVDLSHMSVNSIDSDQYVDGSIDTAHLAASAVTNAKTNFQPGTTFKGDGSSTDGKITINCSANTHGVSIQSPAHASAATYTLTLPTSDGNADEFLQSNGSGVLTWAAALSTIANDAIDSQHYAAASIDLEHMSVNSIDSDQYVDGSIDLAHMSSQSVDEDNLYISNSGTNGQYLQKQSGNNGGLTWADVTSLAGIDDQSSSNDDQLTITDTAVVINEDSDDLDFRIETNGKANAFYVDGGADKIYMGIAASTTLAAGYVPNFVLEGLGDNDNSIGLVQNSNNNSAPSIVMCKTRGTALGATTIIQDNDYLGNIYFGGADGSDRQTYGAAIYGRIDGTPGANDMPTELIFATTADGAASPTNRLIISPAGHLTPAASDTYDLGTSGLIWRDIYTGDLNLTNIQKENGNDIDGTKGSWKIQEGSNDLFIMNKVSGKKYKFKLEEIV